MKNKNSNKDMSIKDDQERCRSLVCDPNGIIVAEMVYRCMICFYVSDTMQEARQHYVLTHIENDDEQNNDNCTNQIDDIDDFCQKNIPKHLNKKLQQQIQQQQQQQQNNNTSRYQNGNRNNNNNNNSLENGIDYSMNSSKYRNSAEPIDMSPSSDSFEHYVPLVSIAQDNHESNGTNNGAKSGYVTCAVCTVTRYYSCVQRRYGQYTCVTCYRNFKSFFDKPERYTCPNLGKCPLNIRTRCRACWIKACIDVFQVDLEKQQLIEQYAPLKHNSSITINHSEEDEQTDHLDDGLESTGNSPINDKMMEQSDDNNNSINGLNNFTNSHLNHSKDALSMMFALQNINNSNATDLPTLLSKSSLGGFGLLTASNANNLFGNLNDNNNNSLINHHSNTNSLNNQTLNGLSNGTSNSGKLFLTPKHLNNKNLNSNNIDINSNNNNVKETTNSKSGTKAKGTAGKKVWSCGKCATCVAEDCGKCIYCLDRPKFGGPFVKKQRCIKRRCLMKIKNKALSKANNNVSTVPSNTSTYVF